MIGHKLLLLLCLLLIACESQGSPPPPPPDITPLPEQFTAAIGLADGALRLPEQITYNQPKLTLTFPTTSDSQLLADVTNDVLDAALVHHIAPTYDSLWFSPVALDGILLVVHPSNPISDLSLAQAQALFAGTLTEWDELGGSGPVALVSRDDAAGVRALFEQMVLRDQRLSINAEIRPNYASIVTLVSGNPQAIGYVPIGALPNDAPVKAVTVNRITASPTTLGTQEYPLAVPIYWVSQTEPVGEVRGILGYLQSREGQENVGAMFGRIR